MVDGVSGVAGHILARTPWLGSGVLSDTNKEVRLGKPAGSGVLSDTNKEARLGPPAGSGVLSDTNKEPWLGSGVLTPSDCDSDSEDPNGGGHGRQRGGHSDCESDCESDSESDSEGCEAPNGGGQVPSPLRGYKWPAMAGTLVQGASL